MSYSVLISKKVILLGRSGGNISFKISINLPIACEQQDSWKQRSKRPEFSHRPRT